MTTGQRLITEKEANVMVTLATEREPQGTMKTKIEGTEGGEMTGHVTAMTIKKQGRGHCPKSQTLMIATSSQRSMRKRTAGKKMDDVELRKSANAAVGGVGSSIAFNRSGWPPLARDVTAAPTGFIAADKHAPAVNIVD